MPRIGRRRRTRCETWLAKEEHEGVIVEPVNFRAIETPAEWNTEGREFILTNFDRMADRTKERFYDYFREWFEGEEE